jgi:Flp pilus assembly protein TadG
MRAKLPLLSNCSARARLARFSACARGVTAIEFAFVAPAILAIMLAALQISTIYVAQSYLEAETEAAMRTVLTNEDYNLNAAAFQTQMCANITGMFTCSNLMIDLQPINNCTGTGATLSNCLAQYQPQINPTTGALTKAPVFNSGAANDKMRLLVMYQWPVIAGPLGMILSSTSSRLLSAVEIFYKEPCISSISTTNCVANNG